MSELDGRLENWGRWLRSHPHYAAAASLEGNYRSPQHWWPVGPRPKETKGADAWDICLACATLHMRYHLTLKLRHYVGLSDRLLGRVLRMELKERVTTHDVQAIEGMARVLLLDALSEPLAIRRERAKDRVGRIIRATLDLQRD